MSGSSRAPVTAQSLLPYSISSMAEHSCSQASCSCHVIPCFGLKPAVPGAVLPNLLALQAAVSGRSTLPCRGYKICVCTRLYFPQKAVLGAQQKQWECFWLGMTVGAECCPHCAPTCTAPGIRYHGGEHCGGITGLCKQTRSGDESVHQHSVGGEGPGKGRGSRLCSWPLIAA